MLGALLRWLVLRLITGWLDRWLRRRGKRRRK